MVERSAQPAPIAQAAGGGPASSPAAAQPPLIVCCSYCENGTPAIHIDRWGIPRCAQHAITYPPPRKRRNGP